jgi:hypothetical protein
MPGSTVDGHRATRCRRVAGGVSLLLSLVVFGFTSTAFAQNAIQLENAKPGTASWGITNGATAGEIEGYASATSVAPGASLTLFVHTAACGYTLQVFRVGWYGGRGAREMRDQAVHLPGTVQPPAAFDAESGMSECAWNPSWSLAVPDSFVSGVYLARLTADSSGKQSYVIFVVRNDASNSSYLFQQSVLTYQAYNTWGGKSLYYFLTHKVSFDRPYAWLSVGSVKSYGAGDFFTWEFDMLGWLEKEGYDVSYCTDLDTHENPALLSNHHAFLVVGHDEYWTHAMREHVEQALGSGVGLGFFGANDCYWQVRLAASQRGQADREVICYRDSLRDPDYTGHDPALVPFVTVRWRDEPVARPEAALIGVQYYWSTLDSWNTLDVADASSWLCTGTRLLNGDSLAGLCGWEVDRTTAESPADIEIVGSSPLPGTALPAEMTEYVASPGGATVFAAGTLIWTWGLKDDRAGAGAHARFSQAGMQITRNALARIAGQPPPPLLVPPAAVATGPVLRLEPSPFVSEVAVRYGVPRAGDVDVSVFGLDGRRLRRLVAGQRELGEYSVRWDGRSESGTPVPPGVYLVRVQAPGGTSSSRRVIRIR